MSVGIIVRRDYSVKVLYSDHMYGYRMFGLALECCYLIFRSVSISEGCNYVHKAFFLFFKKNSAFNAIIFIIINSFFFSLKHSLLFSFIVLSLNPKPPPTPPYQTGWGGARMYVHSV